MNHNRTWKICVTGRVQGVGFRPWVCRLARKLSLTGTVKNLGGVVEINAQGSPRALLSLVEEIKKAPLPIEVENLNRKHRVDRFPSHCQRWPAGGTYISC